LEIGNDLSVSDIMRLFHYDRKTCTKYISKAGLVPVRKSGKAVYYALDDVLWFKPMMQDKMSTSAPTDYDIDEERARETKERADNLEIKNAQLRGELVPVAALKWLVGRICANINSGLESLPMKLKRRVAKLNATDINLMKAEIAKVQSDMADTPLSFDDYDG